MGTKHGLTFFSHGVYASPTKHLRHTNPSVSLLLAAPEGDSSVAGQQQGPEADRAVRERLCEDLRSREGSSGRHLRGCVCGSGAKLRSHGSEKIQGTHCPPWAGGGGREGRIFDHLMHAILHLPYQVGARRRVESVGDSQTEVQVPTRRVGSSATHPCPRCGLRPTRQDEPAAAAEGSGTKAPVMHLDPR